MTDQEIDEQITAALEGATDHADAIRRLRGIGCSESTASNYAAHHLGTHRGDVIERAGEAQSDPLTPRHRSPF